MMIHFKSFKRLNNWRSRRLLLSSVLALLAVATIVAMQPAVHQLWGRPTLGENVLYGKIADTYRWHGAKGESVVKNAKVTINSLPPQTTYTDERGQFWFRDLRDLRYTLKVDVPYRRDKHYSFSQQVAGKTGAFFDVALDEAHNLKEIDY